MPSYLDELDDLINTPAPTTHQSEEDRELMERDFLIALMEQLIERSFWVFYDEYNTPTKVFSTSPNQFEDELIIRVDWAKEPTFMVPTAPLHRAADKLAVKHKYGPVDLSDLVVQLGGRRARKVLLANLRPFEPKLKKTFGSRAVVNLTNQSRVIIVRLRPLLQHMGLSKEDLYPKEVLPIIRRATELERGQLLQRKGTSSSRIDGER